MVECGLTQYRLRRTVALTTGMPCYAAPPIVYEFNISIQLAARNWRKPCAQLFCIPDP